MKNILTSFHSKGAIYMSNEATREQARQILKNGILNMSVERLIQMARYGLIGSIFMTDGVSFTNNMFNHIE